MALQQSFSPDRSIRDPAEASIKQLKFVPGATQMLLHITEEKQVRDTCGICGMFILLESPRCIADFGLYHTSAGAIRSQTSGGYPVEEYLP